MNLNVKPAMVVVLKRKATSSLNSGNTLAILRPLRSFSTARTKGIRTGARAAVAKLFGVNYPGPAYNPDYDVIYDKKIDIKDIAIIAKHYGEVDP